MTKAKAAEAPTPAELRTRIREAGLRCTDARVLVLEHLAGASRPLTHAEVAEAVAARGFDRATIYRNLIELAEAGLVSRVELGDHVWRFELLPPGHFSTDHPHFVCVNCGEISCLPRVTVDIKPSPGSKQSGIRQVTEILLKGRCGQCA